MNRVSLLVAVILPLLPCVFTGCGTLTRESMAGGDEEELVLFGDVALRPTGHSSHGRASWYSVRTNHGTRTASGERLSDGAPTAAHRTLPFGTKVRVTNEVNGRSEVVRITDRGPFTAGRVIDVTIGTAERLGMVTAGVVPVTVEVLEVAHAVAPPTDRKKKRMPSIWTRREDEGNAAVQESLGLVDA